MNEANITPMDLEDIKEAKTIEYKETCCKSYLTSKGRCYTCPENKDKDPDDEDY